MASNGGVIHTHEKIQKGGEFPSICFAVSFATSGHNYAIGPVGVLTIAATALILGRSGISLLDQTINFIREEVFLNF